MTQPDGNQTPPGRLPLTLSLFMPTVLVATGLWAVLQFTWATLGLGVWLFGRAYLKLKLWRVSLADAWDGKVPDVLSGAIKIRGGTYILAAVLLSVGGIVGEGWGCFIPAAGFFWIGLFMIFDGRLAPSGVPWWFQ